MCRALEKQQSVRSRTPVYLGREMHGEAIAPKGSEMAEMGREGVGEALKALMERSPDFVCWALRSRLSVIYTLVRT